MRLIARIRTRMVVALDLRRDAADQGRVFCEATGPADNPTHPVHLGSMTSMRLHLFEWEDQVWFPASLRNAMTSYLVAAYGVTPLPKLWAERLAALMKPNQPSHIVDLGSGSGGPIPRIVKELGKSGFMVRVTLTDLFPHPNTPLFAQDEQNSISYWPEPVDAAKVPPSLRGIRTMFASFHHLPPQRAREVLRDAFEHLQTICIFEGTSRAPAAIASMLLVPLLVLLLTPKVRPVSWVQIAFTYLVPILPLVILWDGIVSQLRTYSVKELGELTRGLESPDYRWEIGLMEIPRMPAGLPYIIGRGIQ